MRYFVQQNQIVSGPYSLEDLRARLHRGENMGTDRVCAEGNDQWILLREALQQEPAALTGALAPQPKRKLGCGGCLLIALASCAALAVALAATAYYILFHTAVPIKWMASSAAPGLSMSGVSGSLSSGFAIKSLRWKGADGEMCEIEDLRLKYSGFSDLARRGEFIIREVNVGKARLIVTSTEASASENNPSSTPRPSTTANQEAGKLKLFRIDRVHFGDVYVKDLRTGFEFSMPAFDYTGLKVENGKVDLGNLHIESDRLDIRTLPGRTMQIGGKTVTFSKLIEGTAKPLLHPAIKLPIKFTLDVGFGEKKKLTYHLTACEDRLEIYFAEDHSGFYRANELPLADYLSLKPYDLPSRVTLDGTMPAEGRQPADKVLAPKGHFTLGVTEFELDAGEVPIETKETNAPYEITARHRGPGEEIVAALKFQSANPQVRPAFHATPALTPRDLLAQIFFGKAYGELAAAEQSAVEAKTPVYFPVLAGPGK